MGEAVILILSCVVLLETVVVAALALSLPYLWTRYFRAAQDVQELDRNLVAYFESVGVGQTTSAASGQAAPPWIKTAAK
jgi:hypothetical protein